MSSGLPTPDAGIFFFGVHMEEVAAIDDRESSVFMGDGRDRVPGLKNLMLEGRTDRQEVHGMPVTCKDFAGHLCKVVAVAVEFSAIKFGKWDAKIFRDFLRGKEFKEV